MWISRRAVMNGIGQSATVGALASALPAQLRAAAAAPAPAAAPVTYSLTRIYRQAEGASFNGNMFRDMQVPNMIKAYGKSAERIELRMPVVAEGQPAPQILAAVNIWFRDAQAFLQKHKAAEKDLIAGMEQITKLTAIEQVDQVMASLGDDRGSVPIDCYVYSTYFPTKEGGTFDAKYFAETFYPKFVQTYGPEALRRVEVTSAVTPKSSVTATTHIYIRDEVAYDTAAREKAPELFAEAKDRTNITPVQTLTKLHAFG